MYRSLQHLFQLLAVLRHFSKLSECRVARELLTVHGLSASFHCTHFDKNAVWVHCNASICKSVNFIRTLPVTLNSFSLHMT